MRACLLFIIFYSSVLYPQKTPNVRVSDSCDYYLELARFNTTINNYGNALIYTQKAINFAKFSKDIAAEAQGSLSLGLLYTEIQKHDDAF